ncbi:MAG: DUF4340 domain-containing protein [Verrucomicrobiota bacterium]
MNTKGTWFWFLLAVGLFTFIFFFERHWDRAAGPLGPTLLLPQFRPQAVGALQVRRGTQFVRLQREGESWRLAAPVNYPAQPVMVDNLLQALARMERQNPIHAKTLADFGLADPAALIVAQQGDTRTEVQVGALTPVGGQVYVRVVGVEDVYTMDASLLSLIPENADAWRSTALLSLPGGTAFDRFEVRSTTKGVGYALQFNTTNRLWRLSKPMQARADRVKVESALLKCLQARVSRFVTDNPGVELEPYGLQPPKFELVLGAGTNDLLVVQFGAGVTNNPDLVYARRMSHTNVVLVPHDLAEQLQVPFVTLRDRHLLAFPPGAVTQIEVRQQENIVIRKTGTNQWRLVEPLDLPADNSLVRELIADLYSFEVAEFEKDVVTDFAGYGLEKPMAQVFFKAGNTNGTAVTNSVLAQADFGTNAAGRFFARRPDESSVYAVREEDFLKVPQYAWQLRDRRVWNFSATNVTRFTVSQGGRTMQLLHRGTNEWLLAPGSEGLVNEYAVEEIVYRLGELTAGAWFGRGEEARTNLGFTNHSYRLELELRDGDRTQTLAVEFGPSLRSQIPLATVQLEGQPWIFQFPWQLFQMIQRDLPLKRPAGPEK